jgi:hypothetical protein
MIDIVLNKGNALVGVESDQRRAQQLVPGHFEGHKIVQVKTLGRGVLDVAHVEIETTAIEEESAIARRLFVIAVVKVNGPGTRFLKQIVLYLSRPKLAVTARLIVTEEAAVFGFDANDSIHLNDFGDLAN